MTCQLSQHLRGNWKHLSPPPPWSPVSAWVQPLRHHHQRWLRCRRLVDSPGTSIQCSAFLSLVAPLGKKGDEHCVKMRQDASRCVKMRQDASSGQMGKWPEICQYDHGPFGFRFGASTSSNPLPEDLPAKELKKNLWSGGTPHTPRRLGCVGCTCACAFAPDPIQKMQCQWDRNKAH